MHLELSIDRQRAEQESKQNRGDGTYERGGQLLSHFRRPQKILRCDPKIGYGRPIRRANEVLQLWLAGSAWQLQQLPGWTIPHSVNGKVPNLMLDPHQMILVQIVQRQKKALIIEYRRFYLRVDQDVRSCSTWSPIFVRCR